MGLLVSPVRASDRPSFIVLTASACGWEEATNWKEGGDREALVRLRREGASLRRFHGNPVAAPGHAELLTGRNFLRNGVSGDDAGEQMIHDLEVTLAEVCRVAGYETGFFGWWRHGCNVPQHPLAQGFASFTGRCRAQWTEDDAPWIQHGLTPEALEEDCWREISEAACRLVERSADRPFLCWVSAPPGKIGLDALNRVAGDLQACLKKEKRSGQTLTIFVADRPHSTAEGNLFGGPGSLSEGGVRIPGFWHWPGVIEPGLTIHEIAQNVDLFVTVAALAGADIPGDRLIDGMNLSPLLRNERPDHWPNRDIGNVVISQRNRATARLAFRTTNWLAVRDPGCRRNPRLAPGETWELFDLQADPLQQYEVGEVYPFVLARLKSDFGRWYLDAAQFDLKPVPLALGRPDVEETRMLPEFAEKAGNGEFRWPLQTPATVEVEVEWMASETPWDPRWKLRIGGVDLAVAPVKVGERRWSLGSVSLLCGRVEAVLGGVPGDFAEKGELVFRILRP